MVSLSFFPGRRREQPPSFLIWMLLLALDRVAAQEPSVLPTMAPSSMPSLQPTEPLTEPPTGLPSERPTLFPTTRPTSTPTMRPTAQPTLQPSEPPSAAPTDDGMVSPEDYLSNPEVEWERNVGGIPGPGNGVVLSKDEVALYVTSANGALTALNPINGFQLWDFVPPRNNQSWEVSCESSIDIYESEDGSGSYLVYAVIDTAPEGSASTDREESRIFAFTHDGEAPANKRKSPRWVSEPVVGVVSGTPQISSDGKYVYFTRTSELFPTPAPSTVPSTLPSWVPTAAPSPIASASPSTMPSITPTDSPTASPVAAPPTTARRLHSKRRNRRSLQSLEVTGYFSVLSDAAGGALQYEQASTEITGFQNHFYGPVSVARNVTGGNYFGQEDNTNDVVVWALMDDPLSPVPEGETQLFQLPRGFDGNFAVTDTVQLGATGWTTQTAPAITGNGQSLYFGTTENQILGWNRGRTFDLTTNFEVQLGGSPLAAPEHPPVFSVDGKYLLLASAPPVTAFQAVNIQTQAVEWTVDLSDVVGTAAVVSPEGSRVYFAAKDAMYSRFVEDEGNDAWTEGAFVHPNSLGGILETEFTLSQDGRVLYYGGYRGQRVSALRVAVDPDATPSPSSEPSASPTVSRQPSTPPTISPSAMPSVEPTASPTARPTARPTAPPNTAAPTTGGDDDGTNVAAIAGGVVGGVVGLGILGFAVYYFFLRGGGTTSNMYDEDYGGDTGGGYGGNTGGSAAGRSTSSGRGGSATTPSPSGGRGGVASGRRPYPGDTPPSDTQKQQQTATAGPRRPYPPGGPSSTPASGAPSGGGSAGPRRAYPPPGGNTAAYGQQTSEVPTWLQDQAERVKSQQKS